MTRDEALKIAWDVICADSSALPGTARIATALLDAYERGRAEERERWRQLVSTFDAAYAARLADAIRARGTT